MARFIEAMTQQQAEAIKDPGSYSVGLVPGLRLNVASSGSKCWTLRYREKESKKTKEIGLGSFTKHNIDEARIKASVLNNKDDSEKSEKIINGQYWTSKDVRSLREMTGCGVVQARNLLNACRGNLRLALARSGPNKNKNAPRAIQTQAPWAVNLARNNESAGHLLTARIQELIEPHIRAAIWQAVAEVIQYENEFIAATDKESK